MSTSSSHAQPDCPTCLAQKGAPVVARARAIPTRLTTADKVLGVTHGIQKETVRHIAHKSGLLHTYALRSPIKCSLPDRTPHKEGLIIQTLCGKVINIGHICGKTYVEGIDGVIQYADDLAKQERIRAKLQAADKNLVKRATDLESKVDALLSYRKLMVDYTPHLAAELQARADKKDPKVEEDAVEKFTRADDSIGTRTTRVSRRIEGLALWSTSSPQRVLSEAKALDTDIKTHLAKMPVDEIEERVLGQRLDTFQSKMSRIRTWLDDAERFTAPSNINLVARVFRSKQKVFSKGGALFMRDPNRGNSPFAIKPDGHLYKLSQEDFASVAKKEAELP